MSPIEFLFELPIQPLCEIVGKWLSLKTIVQLDSAVCNIENRNLLHEVFQSPFCVVSAESSGPSLLRCTAAHYMFEWLYLRNFRSELVLVQGAHEKCWMIIEEYFHLYGRHIKSILMYNFTRKPLETLLNIARHCFYITSLHCGVCPTMGNHSADWSRFTNLRYLLFDVKYETDHTLVTQICSACPWITHLQIVGGDSTRLHIAELPVMPQLRSLTVGDMIVVNLPQFVQSHSSTLHALQLGKHTWHAADLNAVLEPCTRLRTLKLNSVPVSCFTMMESVTTLAIYSPESNSSWHNLQKHCISLQHLYLRVSPHPFNWFSVHTAADAICALPSLQEVHFSMYRSCDLNDIAAEVQKRTTSVQYYYDYDPDAWDDDFGFGK